MATRRNSSINPACSTGSTNGWSGGARVTGLSGFPRATGWQLTASSTGTTARAGVTAGQAATHSLYVRASYTGTFQVVIDWLTSAGGYVSSTAATSFSVTSGTVRRVNVTIAAPAGAALAQMAFPTRAGTVVATAHLVEAGSTLGDYFDGDSTRGAWEGTSGASPSTVTTEVAPTVNAGPDSTVDHLGSFTRAASEVDGGATITARSWTVLSGPSQAGETLSTTTSVTWKPLSPGSYVLRYSATNSAGTGVDDAAITVNPVERPQLATIRITASGAAQRSAANAGAGTVRLAGSGTSVKTAPSATTATIRLSATGFGARNLQIAAVRLVAATTQTSVRPSVQTAAVRVAASIVDRAAAHASEQAASGLVLRASGIATRVIGAVKRVAARPSLAITHELVVVAFIPQAQGPPTLLEIDAITWSGLSWTDELSKAQTLNAGCKIASLTEPILQRLRAPADLPSEMWLYRNGKLVFAGPLLGAQVQGESVSLTARGLLAYLDMMLIEAPDLVFAQADQAVMAKTMVDRWQATEYGHFGIDTSGVQPTGVLRDGTYKYKEEHVVGKRIVELGARINGFDVSVDPASRQLLIAYPHQGQDRSSGEDAVVFDASNITSPNLVWSAAAGDVASDIFGTGTGANTDPIYGMVSNLQLRARMGRRAAFATFDGVSEQATLNDHLSAMRDVRGDVLTVPGPNTRVTPDSDLDSYDVGDTVSYALHELLSVQAPYRLLKRQVSVNQTGQEAVSLQFV